MILKSNLQCGSVLVLTLLMLLFLQFVAIAVVNSTNVSSIVVRNYQTSTELKLASYKIINYVLTNKDYFVDYASSFGMGIDFDLTETLKLNIEYMNYVDKNTAALSGFSIGLTSNF